MVMSIHKLRYSDGYEWLHPIDEKDFSKLRFDGRPRRQEWSPIRMRRLVLSDKGEPLLPCDFPACSGGEMLIINSAAKEAIGATLEAYGELLPLICESTPYWVVNVTTMLDALDLERSTVVRASDSQAVLMITRHVFRPEELGDSLLFKLPQIPRGLIYVGDSFVRLVESASLLGLEFPTVWRAAAG